LQVDDANEGELYDGNDKRIEKKSTSSNDNLSSKINKPKPSSSQLKSSNTENSSKNNESSSLNLLKQLKLDDDERKERTQQPKKEYAEEEKVKQTERRPFEIKPKPKLTDNSNSDSQQIASNSKEYTLTNIDFEMAKDLRTLLFGNLNQSFCDEWKIQNFGFCDLAKLKFGVVQKKGGPCGVLASVQTYILYELIFGQENPTEDTSKDLNIM
jgi:hypothetical protein